MRLSRQAVVLSICADLIFLIGCGLAFPAAEGKFDRSLKVTGPVDLEVTTGSGSIDIRAGSSSAVQIYGQIRANDDWQGNAQDKVRYLMANPPIEQTGNIIRIGRIDNVSYRNNVSISYEIVVPAETQVRSKTGSGSIAMDNIANDVTAQTGSGGIELDQVAGNVDAHTGSGSIRAEQIGGSIKAGTGSGSVILGQTSAERGGLRDVEVSTGSGSVEVSGVNGSLSAHCGSGRIKAEGTPAGDWKLSAASGGVTLQVDPNAAYDLYAHSSSGAIRVDQPVTVTGVLSKHDLRGKVHGGGHLIDVRTSSGSISIR